MEFGCFFPIRESHISISVGGWYQKPIRSVYSVLQKRNHDLPPKAAWWMPVKRINDTMGYDGLFLSVLVFGPSPNLPVSDMDLLPQCEWFAALWKSYEEMALDDVALAPSSRVLSATKFTIYPDHSVHVSRERSRSCEGRCLVDDISGN